MISGGGGGIGLISSRYVMWFVCTISPIFSVNFLEAVRYSVIITEYRKMPLSKQKVSSPSIENC
jgi:hypothetical protein